MKTDMTPLLVLPVRLLLDGPLSEDDLLHRAGVPPTGTVAAYGYVERVLKPLAEQGALLYAKGTWALTEQAREACGRLLTPTEA